MAAGSGVEQRRFVTCDALRLSGAWFEFSAVIESDIDVSVQTDDAAAELPELVIHCARHSCRIGPQNGTGILRNLIGVVN